MKTKKHRREKGVRVPTVCEFPSMDPDPPPALPSALWEAVARRLPTFGDVARMACVCNEFKSVALAVRVDFLPRAAADGSVLEPAAGFFVRVPSASSDSLVAALWRCPAGGSVLLWPGRCNASADGEVAVDKEVHLFGRAAAEVLGTLRFRAARATLDGVRVVARREDEAAVVVDTPSAPRIQGCEIAGMLRVHGAPAVVGCTLMRTDALGIRRSAVIFAITTERPAARRRAAGVHRGRPGDRRQRGDADDRRQRDSRQRGRRAGNPLSRHHSRPAAGRRRGGEPGRARPVTP